MSYVLPSIFWWAALMLLWFGFGAKPQLDEWTVGLLASAMASVWIAIVCKAAQISFRPRARWWLLAPRLFPLWLADCARLTLGLTTRVVKSRRLRGGYHTLKIHSAPNDRRATRDALAIAAVSLPPNTYAVAVDDKANRMLVHRMLPSHAGEDLFV